MQLKFSKLFIAVVITKGLFLIFNWMYDIQMDGWGKIVDILCYQLLL